jgi:hypothetical protein
MRQIVLCCRRKTRAATAKSASGNFICIQMKKARPGGLSRAGTAQIGGGSWQIRRSPGLGFAVN